MLYSRRHSYSPPSVSEPSILQYRSKVIDPKYPHRNSLISKSAMSNIKKTDIADLLREILGYNKDRIAGIAVVCELPQ
jgi:hypothetical protein